MRKVILVLTLVVITVFFIGCVKTVNPGYPQDTKLGQTSSIWGIPMVRVLTAGFNGYPSEPNNTPSADPSTAER